MIVCAWCKDKKRDEAGNWISLDDKDDPKDCEYSTICPECHDIMMDDITGCNLKEDKNDI